MHITGCKLLLTSSKACYLQLFCHASFTSYTHVLCFLVMGSSQWPLLKLNIYGSLSANGQSFRTRRMGNGSFVGGVGGGSGGTILLFLQEISLAENSSLTVVGGNGGPHGGGGGGGGRVHFHWSKIDLGDEYVPVASISGSIKNRYGFFHRRNIITTLVAKRILLLPIRD